MEDPLVQILDACDWGVYYFHAKEIPAYAKPLPEEQQSLPTGVACQRFVVNGDRGSTQSRRDGFVPGSKEVREGLSGATSSAQHRAEGFLHRFVVSTHCGLHCQEVAIPRGPPNSREVE